MIQDHPHAVDVNAGLDRRAAISAEPLDFERDQANFEQIQQRLNELIDKRDGIKLAISVERHGKHPAARPETYLNSEQYRALARNERRAQAATEDVEEEIEELRPRFEIAKERARLARDQRAVELAASFRPDTGRLFAQLLLRSRRFQKRSLPNSSFTKNSRQRCPASSACCQTSVALGAVHF